jgi:hypothetical protein
MMVEKLLQFLVCEIDTQLLKTIKLKVRTGLRKESVHKDITIPIPKTYMRRTDLTNDMSEHLK